MFTTKDTEENKFKGRPEHTEVAESTEGPSTEFYFFSASSAPLRENSYGRLLVGPALRGDSPFNCRKLFLSQRRRERRAAPPTMRLRLLAPIEREIANRRAGLPARIVAKMNQLKDPELIEALCAASAAGVPIDPIVRGFCCLRPGVEGQSENVRVRSIVGRFLEHSRIFHFAAGCEDPVRGDFFIASADWMYRNLSTRVEVVTPILAAEEKDKLWTVLDICLRDSRQAWVLGSDGKYSQLSGPESAGTHEALMELARRRPE